MKFYHNSRKTFPFSSAGFTLMELMLGLAIGVVISASIFLIYTNAVSIDRRSSELSDLSREGYWTLTALEEDLERMIPYCYTDGETEAKRSIFVGGENSLSLLIEAGEELKWVSYKLESEEEKMVQQTFVGRNFHKNEDQVIAVNKTVIRQKTLKRYITNFKGRFPEESNIVSSEILTKHILPEGLRFFYASRSMNSDGGELPWQNQWNNVALPAAVRVVLELGYSGPLADLTLTSDILLPVAANVELVNCELPEE